MSSYGQVAAQVAERKRLNPELFCPAPRCLWRTDGNPLVTGKPCPKHMAQLEALRKLKEDICPQCRLDVSNGKDHHEGCMYFS